jgi:hypothetical protein
MKSLDDVKVGDTVYRRSGPMSPNRQPCTVIRTTKTLIVIRRSGLDLSERFYKSGYLVGHGPGRVGPTIVAEE